MPVLSNPKHELFAQELAKGNTAEGAYTLAGYAPSLKNAQRLKCSEGIRSRVEEILRVVADKAEITIHDLVQQLDEDRNFARTVNSASAAVTATMGKAKLLGFLTEKHLVAGAGPDGEHRVAMRIESHIVDPKGEFA